MTTGDVLASSFNSPEATCPQAFAEADGFVASGYGYLGLRGVSNARDLGGMPAADGRVIASGRLLRSGELAHATADDAAVLRGRSLACVIDLRTAAERRADPEPARRFPGVEFAFVPVTNQVAVGITHDAGFKELVESALSYGAHAEERIGELYVNIVTSQEGRDGYRKFFSLVTETAEKHPGSAVLWHCTAGKDRTGIAAALLETVLGVPRDLVVEDYLASNRYSEPVPAQLVEKLGRMGLAKSAGAFLKAMYGVTEQNLLRAFSAIDQGWGSLDAYLQKELGVGPEQVRHLRELYLEPAPATPSGASSSAAPFSPR